jgi:hypothetical protein
MKFFFRLPEQLEESLPEAIEKAPSSPKLMADMESDALISSAFEIALAINKRIKENPNFNPGFFIQNPVRWSR